MNHKDGFKRPIKKSAKWFRDFNGASKRASSNGKILEPASISNWFARMALLGKSEEWMWCVSFNYLKQKVPSACRITANDWIWCMLVRSHACTVNLVSHLWCKNKWIDWCVHFTILVKLMNYLFVWFCPESSMHQSSFVNMIGKRIAQLWIELMLLSRTWDTTHNGDEPKFRVQSIRTRIWASWKAQRVLGRESMRQQGAEVKLKFKRHARTFVLSFGRKLKTSGSGTALFVHYPSIRFSKS